MVAVPGARFAFGEQRSVGRPGRAVQVASFHIDRTEVTVSAYADCLSAGACAAPDSDRPLCNWSHRSERAQHPINCVSWVDADRFCSWAGRRLPSEEEWELAARGTDGRIYPWGESEPEDQVCVRVDDVGDAGTCAVMAHPSGASPYGALGMAGNVWEWTTGRETFPSGEQARTLRGGGWAADEFGPEVTVLERIAHELDFSAPDAGFRCAR
jgi:formylglycine-generating enzyme required for sulfatase activity